MCGLVGSSGYLTQNDVKAFTLLFHTNVWRGIDGCGLIRLFTRYDDKKKKTKNWYSYHNEFLPSSEYVLTEDYFKLIDKVDCRLLAGHSRAATKGKVNVENTHPFECGNIIGMHNGTIHGKFEGSNQYETDTEALFHLIDKYGLKEALDKAYEQSTSMAYCLVYYDRDKDRVFIIRDGNRPLFIAKHKNLPGKIFWASEKSMLIYALDKSNSLNDYEIYQLPVGDLIEINPFASDPKDRVIYHLNWYKHKPKVITYSNRVHYSNSEGNRWHNHYNQNDHPFRDYDKDTTQTVDDDKDKLIKIQIGNFKVTKKVFNDTLQKGCMMCGSPHLLMNGNFDMRFPKNETADYLCSDCFESYTAEQFAEWYGIDKSTFVIPRFAETA